MKMYLLTNNEVW